MESSEKFLKESGIRPTSTRVLIWEKINEVQFAFSLTDIEDLIPDIDRSTIFRTLVVFEEHHLLHSIADGSGAQKYCVAKSEEEQHVHITCNICHHTYCCKSLLVPKVEVPEGFQVIETSYVIKGICGECSKKISKYGYDGRQ
ncbi:MAG: transcriptional repressor [Paludibacteraceae bacterium]|nr:transcriptional repressor [Paludibacteraceae bacterium]